MPFVFDDHLSVVENPTLHRLEDALSPPHGQGITVEGRPIVIRRTLLALSGHGRLARAPIHPAPSSNLIALLTALWWTVHPLQTESVTYIVQRTESLMGLFFLLTVYTFVRGMDTARPTAKTSWLIVAVFACALGMATKEVMVVAPLIVLLYDRNFVAGSFAAALRTHRGFYSALAATWIVLALAVWSAGNRGGTIGLAAGVTPWQYALTQSHAIVHYLRLAVWPAPLLFDYGSEFVTPAEALPYLLFDAVLLGAIAVSLVRRSTLGFVGAWFFLILAPTTSLVGGTRQMLAEHRTYLSLAAVVVALVITLHLLLGRRARLVGAAVVLGLVLLTARRNGVYHSEFALWADTVASRPGNAHAHYNLANL